MNDLLQGMGIGFAIMLPILSFAAMIWADKKRK